MEKSAPEGESVISDPSLVAYLARVSLALVVLALSAVLLVRFVRGRRGGVRDDGAVKLLASLPVGKDVFFVLRCGPDVVAFTSGAGGTCLMGRWKYEEWVGAGNAPAKRTEDGVR